MLLLLFSIALLLPFIHRENFSDKQIQNIKKSENWCEIDTLLLHASLIKEDAYLSISNIIEENKNKNKVYFIKKLFPISYEIKSISYGFLNDDIYEDIIAVCDNTKSPFERFLIILFGKSDNTLVEAFRLKNAILQPESYQTDFFQNITIQNHEFSIFYFAGHRWRKSQTTTFSYAATHQDFLLKEQSFSLYDDNARISKFIKRDTNGIGCLPLRHFDALEHTFPCFAAFDFGE